MDPIIKVMLKLIRWLIDKLFFRVPTEPATALLVTVSPSMPVGQRITITQIGDHQMKITLSDIEELPLLVTGLDKKGKPAPIEGVTFTSPDENLATVDGAGLVKVGALEGVELPANVRITVRADAAGPNDTDIFGFADIEIIASEAVTLVIGGTPTPAPVS